MDDRYIYEITNAMSEYRNRAIIIVRAEDREAANTAADSLDEATGGETFTQGLSPTGARPATHYWCSVAVTDEQWRTLQMMKLAFTDSVVAEWYMDADPQKPERLLEELGLQRLNMME